jgi:predicted  nucleic acid-binding Zn-ribbon protein
VDSIEERVATLEGRTLEQSMRIDDVREAVSRLEARIGSLEERFDRRFEQLEQRLDQRFVAIDLRFGGIDNRLESMNKLLWGVLITTTGGAISVIAGIVAAVFR